LEEKIGNRDGWRRFMIKMKELLSLNEDVEKDIKRNIDELGQLDREIEELQKKLKPLRKKYGELVENVLPILKNILVKL